ncbi:hypothetical protein BKA70DRAFT_568618 [Coprinopsis sp. MPI-PUGE-AT-0042]|nr:hypothetical protein BKA70DRAFT_568618 [Coprinopsis sp. MPI-PUGE-AT-0042]
MFSALRSSIARPSSLRAFSTTSARQYDVAKLTLIGTLVRDPEARVTKNQKEYVMYTVATQNYPPLPQDPDAPRQKPPATYHRVLSFSEGPSKYLKNLKKGSKVYVEANYELREPEAGADPTTAQGQRQIFLRHEAIRVLSQPRLPREEGENEGSSTGSDDPFGSGTV